MSGEELFTAEELGRLARLRIRRRRAVRGGEAGAWRSARHGAGGPFADHRPYVPGDDLRYVDWNVFGRLGALFVKRFETEESLDLLLCLDRSLSMADRKGRAARRLAGALGYLALTRFDTVRVAWMPRRKGQTLATWRGSGGAPAFLADLAGVPTEGSTDHVRDLAPVVAATRRRALAVVISDFYDPRGAIRGPGLLRSRGLDVCALHVVDPADAELPPGSSVLLEDRETGERLALDVTPALLERVRQAWTRRAVGVERWCLGREIPYLRVDARRSLWDVLRDLFVARIGIAG